MNEKNNSQNHISILFLAFSIVSVLLILFYSWQRLASFNCVIIFKFQLFTSLTILTISMLVIKNISQESLMIITLACIGCFYFILCPFQMVPDEEAHFLRAFEISTGHLFSKQLSSGQFGNVLPRVLADKSGLIDWTDLEELAFTNTALYSFVNYIPQAIGILFARFFTKQVVSIYYAGRFLNFICAFALSVFALKKMPFGKKILFIIMVFPMTMQEMISMAPDALINALSFVFIAFILHCAYQKEKLECKDFVIIGILLVLIALCKIVYLGAVFLVYLIPNQKLKNKKYVYILKIVIPLIAIFFNFIFLISSTAFLATSKLNGSDSNEQIKFMIANPLNYMKIFIRSLVDTFKFCIMSCIGSPLGWLNIENESWILFLALLIYFTLTCNDINVKLRKIDMLIYLLYVSAGIALIFTSEYVGWTTPKADFITGVQGRYLIPLVPCLLLPIVYKNYFDNISFGNYNAVRIKSSYLYILSLVFNFYVLITVCAYYIIYPA